MRVGYALAATAAALWALNRSLARFMLDDGVDALRLAPLRSLLTFAILAAALAVGRPALLRVRREDLPRLAFLGIAGLAGAHATRPPRATARPSDGRPGGPRAFANLNQVRPFALLFALAALVGAPATAQAASCKDADALPTARTVKRAQTATLCLLNKERRKRGLSALRENRPLVKAAGGHSRDMVRRGYFAHDTPEGKDPGDRITATGYRFSRWGENIAWGGGKRGTPASIVRSWMGSPGHRANILNGAFKDSGIGIAAGDPKPGASGFPAATYTQVFATPR